MRCPVFFSLFCFSFYHLFYHHYFTLNLPCINDTPRWRILVTSSLNEISTDQHGQRGEGVIPPTSTPFNRRLLDILKTTWTVFLPPQIFTSSIPIFTHLLYMNVLFDPVGRPAWVDMQMATRLRIPHTFVLHTYTKPTKCHFCNKVSSWSDVANLGMDKTYLGADERLSCERVACCKVCPGFEARIQRPNPKKNMVLGCLRRSWL